MYLFNINNLKSDQMKKKVFFIKKTRALAWALILFIAVVPVISYAQDQNSPVFAVVEYMKVKQGDEQKYIDLERNHWKKIHQERVDKGEIVRWVLYEVRFAGSDDQYNYVTATIVSDLAKLESPFEGIDPEQVLQGEDVDKIMQETSDSRQLVKRNLISMVSSADINNSPAPFEYLEVNFMKVKPGNDALYTDVENTIWKPVHQQFVDDGSRAGWALWQTIYPGGSGNDYQYATTNYYADFSKLNAADMDGAFAKVHSGKDIDKLMQETNNSRDMVRTELWRVVDAVPSQ